MLLKSNDFLKERNIEIPFREEPLCSAHEHTDSFSSCPGSKIMDFREKDKEVKEETGLSTVNIVKPIDVSHYFRGEKNADNEMVVITYWCETTSDEVILSTEHNKYRWVSPEEALSLIEDAPLKRNIQRFLEEKNIREKSF